MSGESLLSARCATPLSLANAPLAEVPAPLECNKSSESEYYEYYTEPGSSPLLLSSSELHLVASHYSPAAGVLSLAWRIDDEVGPYSCGQIHVFQEQEAGVDLVSQANLACNSSTLASPHILHTDLQLSTYSMEAGLPYIVCVSVTTSKAVFPGCTGSIVVPDQDNDSEDDGGDGGGQAVDVLPPEVVVVHPLEEQTGISGLAVNSSLEGEVSVYLRTTVPRSYRGTCRLHVGVSVPGSADLLGVYTSNCSQATHTFARLPPSHIYRVCAVIQVEETQFNEDQIRCLLDKSEDCALAASPHVRYRDRSVLPLLLALVFLALAIACLTVLYLLLRYRRRGSHEHEDRRPRRLFAAAYSPLFLSVFCVKLRRKLGRRGSHTILDQCDPEL